jgi:6-phospho-3-hexuloisomerase
MTDYKSMVAGAAAELQAAAARVNPDKLSTLIAIIATARRIALYGVGREGLMMRALAMRLYHLGLDAHMVGDMSCPPLGPGDLLIVSAGPGDFSTVAGLVRVAQGAGATTACITAQPTAPVPKACDHILTIPAQTMADDQTPAPTSVLPMGSLFEGAQFLVFEILILHLRDHIGVTPAAMRARHTNLE